MANDIADVKNMFVKAGATLHQNDVWSIQGTPVVKHKALERLAAALKIRFQAPTILRAEREEAVILVSGEVGSNGSSWTEWSIGEACVNVNYRVTGKMAAYVYAMAEKRAKDRVILKLAGLQGVYSEEEADEFKERGDVTTMLEATEKSLEAAAREGMKALRTIWNSLDDDAREAFGGQAPQRFKDIATAADQTRKAA